MKTLFIYYDTSSSEPPRVGYGVAYLSGFLKRNNHQTNLCYFRSDSDIDLVLKTIEKWRPNLVAHSSTSSSFYSVITATQRIREKYPKLFQICGGCHVSLRPNELEKNRALDAICIGYGEYPLLELANALENGNDYSKILNLHLRFNKQIVKNPLRAFPNDLGSFLPCDRQIFYEQLDRFPNTSLFQGQFGESFHEFIFCRGCPFDCTFCCNHIFKKLGTGKFINYPPADKCIEDILTVRREYNMTGVAFHDDAFTINKNWFRNFLTQYKKIAIPYVCNLRIGTFDKEDVKLLKKSGCRIAIIGIESGNDYIRNTILKKGISRNEIISSFQMLHNHGIGTYSQNMIGIPGETAKHFIDTVKINAEILPNRATLSVFYPYPGTILYSKCIEDKLFKSDIKLDTFFERVDSNLNLPYFPSEEIKYYKDNFHKLIDNIAKNDKTIPP